MCGFGFWGLGLGGKGFASFCRRRSLESLGDRGSLNSEKPISNQSP